MAPNNKYNKRCVDVCGENYKTLIKLKITKQTKI